MNDSNTLEVGDIVTLNSGGPEMTVEGVTVATGVQCVWFPSQPTVALLNEPEIHTIFDSSPTRTSFPAAALRKKSA